MRREIIEIDRNFALVHEEGVEPSSLAAPEPKSGAYASSATRAIDVGPRSAPHPGPRGARTGTDLSVTSPQDSSAPGRVFATASHT